MIFKRTKSTPIDEQIDSVLLEMTTYGVQDPKYPTLMAYLERLEELKTKHRRETVSKDTIALVVGNILGILVIVAYEQHHVMTSKAFTQIIRPERT